MDRGISDVKLKGLAMSPNADARAQMVRDHHLGLDVLAHDDDENVRYAVLEALRDELNGGLLDVSKCEDQADYIQHFLNSRDLECVDRMFSGTGHTDLLRVLDAWSDQNPEKCLSKENHHSDAEWAEELDIDSVSRAARSKRSMQLGAANIYRIERATDLIDRLQTVNQPPMSLADRVEAVIGDLSHLEDTEFYNVYRNAYDAKMGLAPAPIVKDNTAHLEEVARALVVTSLGDITFEELDGVDCDLTPLIDELRFAEMPAWSGLPSFRRYYDGVNEYDSEGNFCVDSDDPMVRKKIAECWHYGLDKFARDPDPEVRSGVYSAIEREIYHGAALAEIYHGGVLGEVYLDGDDPDGIDRCKSVRRQIARYGRNVDSRLIDSETLELSDEWSAVLSEWIKQNPERCALPENRVHDQVKKIDFESVDSESFHSRVDAMISDMEDGDMHIDFASLVGDGESQIVNRVAGATEETLQPAAGELWSRKAVAEANFDEYQKISDEDDDKSLEEFVKMASDSGMSMKVNNLGISMTSEDWAEFDKRSADARFANVNEFDSDGDFDVDSDDPLVRARIAHVWRYGLDKLARDPDFNVRWEVYSAMCNEIHDGKVDKIYISGTGDDSIDDVDLCGLIHHRIADWDPKDADESLIDSRTLNPSVEWKAVLNQWAEQHPERCALPENRAYDRIKNREGLDELAASSNPEVRYEVRQALADDYKAGKLDMYGGIAKAGDILVSQMERLSEEEMSIPFNPRSAEDDVLKAWIRKNPDKCALAKNKPNDVSDKLDSQMIADGWQAVQKRVDYNIAWSKVAPGTQVYNVLEDTHYTTDEDKCIVITGTEFEQWPVTEAKLRSTYDVPDKTINVGDAGLASPLPDGNVVYVRPANGEETIKTSWGDELHANRPGIEHGDGDVVVASFDDPHNDQWVVNGAVFKSTYERANYDEERVLGRLQEAQAVREQEAEVGTVEVEEGRETMEVSGPAEDVASFA